MGVSGSVTAAVSGSSVTLPDSNMTIVGMAVYAATASGFVSIPIDGSRSAVIPWKPAVVLDVTTSAADFQANIGQMNTLQRFHFKTTGSTLNFTTTGLTGGTYIFYYGTPLPGSIAMSLLAAVTSTFAAASFSFPAGPVRIVGALILTPVDASPSIQTGRDTRVNWNTSSGRSVTVMSQFNDQLNLADILPLGPDADGKPGLSAAQTLTITVTSTGTVVGTGYVIAYYILP